MIQGVKNFFQGSTHPCYSKEEEERGKIKSEGRGHAKENHGILSEAVNPG